MSLLVVEFHLFKLKGDFSAIPVRKIESNKNHLHTSRHQVLHLQRLELPDIAPIV